MFKKAYSISIFFLLILLCFSITKGQNQGPTVAADFRFCDDNYDPLKREFTVFGKAGEKQEVCGIFSSLGEYPVEITYGLSVGTFDQNGVQVCDQDMSSNNNFSKLFLDQERTFIINPGEKKEIKETINIPLGMSGMIYGCITYKGKQQTRKEGKLFDIVMRKAVKLNFFIGGDSDIKSNIILLPNKGKIFSSNKKIKAVLDENNKLNLNFTVKNAGNIDQNVGIKGTIYNALGFEKQFEIAKQKIGGGSQQEFTTNIGIIPIYKGFFKVEIEISGNPVFPFDSSNIKEEFKKPLNFKETSQLFIFSWIWIFIIILTIAIIYIMLRPVFKRNLKK